MFPNLFFFERQYSKSTTAAAPGSSFPSGVWNPTANPFDATSKQPKLQSTHIERERPSSENLHPHFPFFSRLFCVKNGSVRRLDHVAVVYGRNQKEERPRLPRAPAGSIRSTVCSMTTHIGGVAQHVG